MTRVAKIRRLYLSLYFPTQRQILDCLDEYLEGYFAYVTLVMNGPRYVAGAAVLGFKLQRLMQTESSTMIKRYCFVTQDVNQVDQEFLRTCFDHVILVPCIQATTTPMITTRQRELYQSWINGSFTKWNIFNPNLYPEGPPDKVLFLDCDLLPRRNLDHLFRLSAPAACFSNWLSIRYAGPNGVRDLYEYHQPLKHGEWVSPHLITQAINLRREVRNHRDSFTFAVSGVVVLIEPNFRVYHEMLEILRQHQAERRPYGFPGVYSGADEQMLCQLMLYLYERDNKHITHIGPGYVWNAGKEFWVPNEEERAVIHYYGSNKPWLVPIQQQHADTQEWWDVAKALWMKQPKLSHYLYLHKLS